MTACHDPYQELEVYLEKAQEEIGKAFEELNCRSASLAEQGSPWGSFEPLLPPPPAFRSPPLSKKRTVRVEKPLYTTVNRVCYDGNIIDFVHTLPSYPAKSSGDGKTEFPPPLRKTLSQPSTGSFFSKIYAGLLQQNGSGTTAGGNQYDYSPETRRRLYHLRSSFSLENGSRDRPLDSSSLSKNFGSTRCQERPSEKSDNFTKTVQEDTDRTKPCDLAAHRLRPRSASDTSLKSWSVTSEDHCNAFPRPPSGDVNLLSVWADNLVQEINNSFSGELSDSVGICNSVSDCGFCSTKQEFSKLPQPASTVIEKNIHPVETPRDTKYVSTNSQGPSTNSDNEGLSCLESKSKQMRINILEPSVDCVDSTDKCGRNDVPYFLLRNETYHSVINDDVFDSITPPPPEFDDDPRRFRLFPAEVQNNDVTVLTVRERRNVANAETQTELSSDVCKPLHKPNCLLATNSVSVITICDEPETLEENSERADELPRVIPVSALELEESPTVSTVLAVAEETCEKSSTYIAEDFTNNHKNSSSPTPVLCTEKATDGRLQNSDNLPESPVSAEPTENPENTVLQENSQSYCCGLPKVCCANDTSPRLLTFPKHILRFVETDRLSSSLPRDGGRGTAAPDELYIPPQRASSSPSVSSVSKVSLDEVVAFMSKVKNSTYYPPPRADVCVDVKHSDCDSGEPNKDAVTQTTPDFSRCSSFTWVAECDCSDLDSCNFHSGSEESLFLSCSNCTPGKETSASSSSSASPVSSEEDERAFHSSLSSSLSLSACSVNSCEKGEKPDIVQPKSETATLEDLDDVDKKGIPEVTINKGADVAAIISIHGPSETCSMDKASCDAEEERATEIVSVVSMEHSPTSSVSSDSTTTDQLEQSSSFPSTLKSSRESHVDRVAHVAINELHIKSTSLPLLRVNSSKSKVQKTAGDSAMHQKESKETDTPSFKNVVTTNLAISSAKELSELQAIEACSWLRAAGFPQYAQMYEDNLFPIEICTVQKDHAFLHPDSIQSLFRRLNTLNRCARMKFIDNIPRKSLHLDESEDEDQCALSENWQFQRTSRRWSRVPSPPEGLCEISSSAQELPPSAKSYLYPPASPVRKYLSPEEPYCSSHDSVFIDEQNSSPDSIRRVSLRSDERYNVALSNLRGGSCSPASSSGSGGTLSQASEETSDAVQRNLRRSGSDRIKEGAKAIFRRMESLKGKRKKKSHNIAHSEHKRDVSATRTTNSGSEGSPSSSMTPSPQLSHSERVKNDNLHDTSDCSQGGTPQLKHRRKGWGVLFKGDSHSAAYSDSESPVLFVSERWKDANCNDTKVIEHYMTSQESVTITTSTPNQDMCVSSRSQKLSTQESTNCSLLRPNQVSQKSNWVQENFDHSEEEFDKEKRDSFYDNLPAPLAVFNNSCIQDLQESDQQKADTKKSSTKPCDQALDEAEIIQISTGRRDSGVGSSLKREIPIQAPWHCFFNRTSPLPPKEHAKDIPITTLSAPQVLVLRKLSLLKLTTLMEKFSPSSRTGWSWGVPKFIRRIRTPDYKDKVVFGVPLLLVLQRTGQPLPISIQAAIHYLRKTALDSIGLFRKSGVRSRIQKLRNLNESSPEKINYEDQQAYDVADMLKLYFRELPEALLTNKLSETFISIYQYIPEELRLEAIQAAILLMPDENREVLQSLLSFLQEVCQHSTENQMTATNLAVCFAPSLFHLSTPRSASASPRRRKTVGVPDLRELNENKAAYECLSTMVVHYKDLFTISEEMLSQCRLSHMEDCEPVSFEELTSTISDGHPRWRVYIDSCIHALLKELKDKSKGWEFCSQMDGIELSYRKVGDSHPLRLWKVSTEVEAPPAELLNRILWERHIWDSSFLKWRVLQRLDKHTEIFQYVSSALPPHPPCDYCVLRSWRTDLPKGTCVLIESSTDYPEAQPMIKGIRAIVLASRYLIEPCGSGKSRITHINRVDTRGRSPEWYNRAFGQICTLQMTRLRDSFSHSTRAEGPETKV